MIDKQLTFVPLSTLCIKVIIGVYLLEYAKRRQMGMEVRKKQDVVNDFGRDPIGEGKEERVGASFSFSYK